MAVVLDQPGYGPLKLRPGIPAHLGSITAANDAIKFVLPGDSHQYGHGVGIQAVANGTVTTLTTELDVSLDGGTTFVKVGTGPAAAPGFAQIETKGLGGQLVQVLASAVTLGTATKIDLYAVAG